MAKSENQSPVRDIERRTFEFAVRAVRLVNALPATTAGTTMARQIMRSGTSVGANVEEAQGSHSRKEFARKMNIARSEAREVLYWLRLARETKLLPASRLTAIVKEADELVRILTAIVKRARSAPTSG